MNKLKKKNTIQITDTSNLVKKLTIIQKLIKMKRKLPIMIIINIFLLKNLRS